MEVYDQVGDKYTITFRDRVTRDNTIRLLDLVELLGGMPRIGNEPKLAWHKDKLTKFERVRLVVEKYFPVVGSRQERLNPHTIFENNPFFIDVSQTVLFDHPLALELLKRDIDKINSFFRTKNVSTTPSVDLISKFNPFLVVGNC